MTWGEPKVEVLMDVRVSVVDEPDDHVPMERESEMRTRHANVVTADVALRRNEAAGASKLEAVRVILSCYGSDVALS